MDFFDLLTMLGGLALFLYGMETMGEGLAKASGGKLERILEQLTSNTLKAVLLGAGVTAVIQSSSATTVMVVGFVNSGMMQLTQAVGIIMGANIGTTITSWILSLSGIESSHFFVRLLKPASFSPVMALIGVCFLMFSKKEKKRDVGLILIGFAILMTGMDTMSSSVRPLADVPEFTGLLTMFSNPVLGMLCGALLTAVIQSSSASVGILQALCATGAVSFGAAIPIIMGQNIGTCVTAVLSGIGAHKNAKRTALVHLYFNLMGTIIFMTIFYILNSFMQFEFMKRPVNAAGIAAVHTAFNVAATLVLFPFSKALVKLACLTIPESENKKEDTNKNAKDFQLLDMRFLDTPGYAVEQSRIVAVRMAELVKKALYCAVYLLDNFNEELTGKVMRLEKSVDRYEDELGSYLVKLSAKNLSERDSHTVTMLLHCIGDFERISDHAVNIVETAQELHQKKIHFSSKAREELKVFTMALTEIVDSAFTVFSEEDYERAAKIEPLEETIDYLNQQLKKRHVERLRTGACTMELGFALADLTTNFERISDHCSNVAIALIQSRTDGYEAHEYTARLHRENNPEFQKEYMAYRKKYILP
ncbi:MAG: Na/Pi cotransporter family protein [Lachnospiraceae bacterium]